MTSVERILEYTDVEMEPPLESAPSKRPPPSWPPKGSIEFDKAVLRYDPDGAPVLHGVSFYINPQEKVSKTLKAAIMPSKLENSTSEHLSSKTMTFQSVNRLFKCACSYCLRQK